MFATSYPGSIETLDNINSPSNMFSASCSIIKTFCDSYSNIFLGRNINNSENIDCIKFNTVETIKDTKNTNISKIVSLSSALMKSTKKKIIKNNILYQLAKYKNIKSTEILSKTEATKVDFVTLVRGEDK